jgi:hypothetical protein
MHQWYACPYENDLLGEPTIVALSKGGLVKQIATTLLLVAVALPVHAQKPVRLEPGKAVDMELGPGGRHVFELDLDADRFVYGEAEQQDVDVVVTLYGPDGQVLETANRSARGPEPFRFESRARASIASRSRRSKSRPATTPCGSSGSSPWPRRHPDGWISSWRPTAVATGRAGWSPSSRRAR